jgi:hypothetical protein
LFHWLGNGNLKKKDKVKQNKLQDNKEGDEGAVSKRNYEKNAALRYQTLGDSSMVTTELQRRLHREQTDRRGEIAACWWTVFCFACSLCQTVSGEREALCLPHTTFAVGFMSHVQVI